MRRQPGLGVFDHDLSTALQPVPMSFALHVRRKVVVEIETTIESWSQRFAIENDGADEGGGVISLGLEQLRHRSVRVIQWDSEVRHAVNAGQKPGQNAGV